MPISSPTLPSNLDRLTADELRVLLLQQHTMIVERDNTIAEQRDALAEREQLIADRDDEIAEREQLIAERNDEIAKRERLIAERDAELLRLNTAYTRVMMEIAILKRIRFDKANEHLKGWQALLFEEDIKSDIAEKEEELHQLAKRLGPEAKPAPRGGRRQFNEANLPKGLEEVVIHHEPDSTTCGCGCQLERIGEDVSSKLDYIPGVFKLEKHVRGKYVCHQCKTLTQAPVPPHIIDKGLPSTGLLASVLTMKYADHLPLYRQEQVFERAGIPIARSTLADWVGHCGAQLQPLADALREAILSHRVLQADETPVRYMHHKKEGAQRGYFWVYAPSAYESMKAVVYDFKPGRSGTHARDFLGHWQGSLMCDDYAGYKALFASGDVIEGGCWAHARRKFHNVYVANESEIAEKALAYIQQLYHHEERTKNLSPPERLAYRRAHMKPLLDKLHEWLIAQQAVMPPSSAIIKAINYSLNNWTALTRLLDDAQMPIDNNAVENLIRPLAVGRKNWLFVGSEIAGRRAAAVMSLIQSARLNGLDPYAYLRDVLERLPTHKAKDIDELLPHNWQPLH